MARRGVRGGGGPAPLGVQNKRRKEEMKERKKGKSEAFKKEEGAGRHDLVGRRISGMVGGMAKRILKSLMVRWMAKVRTPVARDGKLLIPKQCFVQYKSI